MARGGPAVPERSGVSRWNAAGMTGRPALARGCDLVVAMEVSRQSVVDTLRRLGYAQQADEALQELPDPVDYEQVKQFGEQHGISRDELIDRMGGSP